MAYRRGEALLNRHGSFLAASKIMTWLVELIGYPIMVALYGFRISGRDTLRDAGILPWQGIKSPPHILVSNHTLPLDPLLHALSILPRFTYFTLLEETVLTPVLGTLVRLLGGIPVPREQARLYDIQSAVETGLQRRGLVHFYPEGECFLLNQEIKPFKAGAFYYAVKMGIPVMPIVTVLRRRTRWRFVIRRVVDRKPAQVRVLAHVHILPPMLPPTATGKVSSDLHQAILFARQVRAKMQRLIDSEDGDKSICRGPMPRIKGVNDRNRG
jgi:1-acyl-sn-glycerol-3-phosphate acyltransferase